MAKTFDGIDEKLGRFLAENPWILAAIGLGVLLLLLRYLRRRFTFQVARRA